MPRPLTPETLFADNQKLAFFALHQWTRRYSGFVVWYGMDTDDLTSIALAGLWRAARGWNPRRGQFSTVAIRTVHNDLTKHLVRFRRVKRGGGTAVTISLDAPAKASQDDSAPRLDLLRAPTEDAPDARTFDTLDRAALWQAVETLPTQQAEIIRRSFVDGETMAQIGEAQGISRQRAHQLLQKGLKQLKATCPQLAAVS